MKRTILGAAGALTLAAGTAFAAAGDAWYDTNRNLYTPQPVQVLPEGAVVEGFSPQVERVERIAEAPVLVEREYVYTAPPDAVVVYDAPYAYDSRAYDRRTYDPMHPESGQRIGRGLFNRAGPNDFGA